MPLVTNPRTMIAIGSLSLAASLLLNRFVPNGDFVDLLGGVMLGLSLAFNFKALLIIREQQRAREKCSGPGQQR